MKTLLKITIVFVLFFFSPQKVWADSSDVRVEKLTQFLKFYNSSLTDYAEDFVKYGDKYGVDWKLLPAIAGVESTFGKAIPYNSYSKKSSYNAYGWGGGEIVFTSWEESIDVVTKSLRQNYINRGLTNPDLIGPVYCPPNRSWEINVKFFMQKLEIFTPSDTSSLELSL